MRVLVVGMGKSGKAAADALREDGAFVTTYDQKENPAFPTVTENGKAIYDQLIMSPGVPLDLPFVQEAAQAGSEIIGELELAYRMGQGTYYAVTGTNGKTTTTALIGAIFQNAGRDTRVVGNIGNPVVTEARQADANTCLVTECSSFQLDTCTAFHPHIATLLNLTPDHLDRHKTAENYYDAKAKIAQAMTEEDYWVVNADDPEVMKRARASRATLVPFSRTQDLREGVILKSGVICIRPHGAADGTIVKILPAEQVYIPGNHNLENAMAAVGVAYYAGIDPAVIANTLQTFRGVEHRMEFAGEARGVRFVNDSKGTNPDAAIKALEATRTPIWLIAGGYDKGSSYDAFIDAFGGKVKGLMLLGKTAPKIADAAKAAGYPEEQMHFCANLKECVTEAFRLAEAGDTILLSPACASWDMYACFEERGEEFKALAHALGAR